MSRRVTIRMGGIGALALAILAISPALASAKTQVCSGTPESPGVLAGNYEGDVAIEGFCVVNSGPANVKGSLTLRADSGLLAAFARNVRTGEANSRLNVGRNLVVERGATLFMGCLPTSSPCLDDPSREHPTLSSADTVGGNLRGINSLGEIVHNTTIGGNVTQTGGGGGFTCDPTGIFTSFGSPVFSTYEDSSVGGSVRVADVHSCWMGLARVNVGRSARYIGNQLEDPDAIEIVSNHIHGDLVCRDNSMVWDSGEISGALFPRAPQPNEVNGKRVGQCVLASKTTGDGHPGPGPF